jgi:hypothetical protein
LGLLNVQTAGRRLLCPLDQYRELAVAWYNWVAIAIFLVSATVCYTLNKYEDDASFGVRAGQGISLIIAAACVVMFALQGLELLQA